MFQSRSSLLSSAALLGPALSIQAASLIRPPVPSYSGRSARHVYLHPTKGWRGEGTYPAGTNRRRKRTFWGQA